MKENLNIHIEITDIILSHPLKYFQHTLVFHKSFDIEKL
jgi:hypothetical protein